jgi:hypothetical protein
MLAQIFDIKDGKVIPGISCYIIPEFKAIVDTYENPIAALSFIWAKYIPNSSYTDLEEKGKDKFLMEEFPGDYSLEDDVMINACNKAEFFTNTPSKRFYESNKILLDRLSTYARTSEIIEGNNGNLGQLHNQILKADKMMEAFRKVENVYKEEISSTTRGNKDKGYDEFDDNE